MSKISAVISAFNEEKNIEECLKTLNWVDEIIVIDNSSTDKTSEIAKKYTEKIFTQRNDPKAIDLLKNFGFEKASSVWILSIDADERVSEDLAKEIREKIDSDEHVAYYIPRKNYIFKKWIEHTGWYPDYQLRLFKKGQGKFVEAHVHEDIKIEGKIGYLKNNLIHNNYESVSQFLVRSMLYSKNEAEYKIKNGYKLSRFDAVRFPFNEFLSRFFAREGYKDGLHLMVLSVLMSFYHFMIFVYIWEKEGFKEEELSLKELKNESFKLIKELKYWIKKSVSKNSKNPLRKLF